MEISKCPSDGLHCYMQSTERRNSAGQGMMGRLIQVCCMVTGGCVKPSPLRVLPHPTQQMLQRLSQA
eukprot:3497459-Amphidinium_carterae.2